MPFDPPIAWGVLLYAALAILPGAACLALVERGVGGGSVWRDPFVRLGLAAGLGLAVQPIKLLWLHRLGLPAGPWFGWVLLAASSAVLLGGVWRTGFTLRSDRMPPHPAHAALGGMLVAVLLSRWWAARSLLVPSWGDSVHHTVIVRLFTLHDGLVDTWLPFAPLSTFTYHFGWHAGVASLVELSGLPEPTAVIVAGQVLMVLQVLTAYALAAGLTGRPWAGVAAGLAAAGLGTMPAYFVNWGRYTQLAGQTLLPAALLGVVAAAGPFRGEPPGARVLAGRIGLAAILTAGLALTHYIVTLMFAAGCGAWLVVAARGDRAGARAHLGALGRMAVVAFAAVLLAAPWIPQFLAGPLGATAVGLTARPVADPTVYGVAPPSALWNAAAIGFNVGWPLVAATLAAGAWGLARRQPVAVFGLVWMLALGVLAYPWLVGLPGTGLLKDAVAALGLYLPAGVVIGAAFGDAAVWGRDRIGTTRAPDDRPADEVGRGRPPPVAGWGLAAAVSLVAVVLAWNDRDVVSTDNILVLDADVRALGWVRAHTPPDARFLVGSFPAFGDTVLAGDDAGWWLPLLAEGRTTTLPPITYGIERAFDPAYRTEVNRLAERVRADLDAAGTRAALAEAGVTHAFVGVKGTALDRARLDASPYWERVYAADGAAVYRVRGGEAAP